MPAVNPLPAPPPAQAGSLLRAFALVAIGILGAFGLPSRWDGPLALPFGPEGVRPLKEALTWAFLLVAAAGFAWLLRLRPLPSGEQTLRGMQLGWLRIRVATMLFLLALFATVATQMWLHLGARAAWRGEWWGADGTVRTAVRLFAGLALFAALALVSRIRELRAGKPGGSNPPGTAVSNPAGSITHPR